MKKDGYQEQYSSALISAASILGPIIFLQFIFVVYAARADVSIKGLFMAGITPGILIAIGYAILIFIDSKTKPDFPATHGDFNWQRMIKALLKHFLHL